MRQGEEGGRASYDTIPDSAATPARSCVRDSQDGEPSPQAAMEPAGASLEDAEQAEEPEGAGEVSPASGAAGGKPSKGGKAPTREGLLPGPVGDQGEGLVRGRAGVVDDALPCRRQLRAGTRARASESGSAADGAASDAEEQGPEMGHGGAKHDVEGGDFSPAFSISLGSIAAREEVDQLVEDLAQTQVCMPGA